MRSRLRTFPIKVVHGKNVVRVKPRRYSYYTGDHCLNSLFRLLRWGEHPIVAAKGFDL